MAPQPPTDKAASALAADSARSEARTNSPNSSPQLAHQRDLLASASDAKRPGHRGEVVESQDSYTERKRKTGYLTGLIGPADSRKLSESQRAQALAQDLARKIPRIKKIKICRDLEEEDWWICLYEEKGQYFELQQYIWNAYQDRPQPFLVLERIARSGLQKHLAKVSPGMKCQVLDPPGPQGWLAQIEKARGVPADRAASPLHRVAPAKGAGEHLRKAESVKARNGPHVRGKQSEDRTSSVAGSRLAKQSLTDDVNHPPTIRRESATRAAAERSRPPEFKTAQEKAKASRTIRDLNSAEKNRPVPRIALESDGEPRFRHAYAPSQPSFRSASVSRRPQNPSSGAKAVPEGSPVITPPSGSSQEIRRSFTGTSSLKNPAPESRDSQARRPTYFVFAYGSKMNHTDFLAWLDANGYDSSMVVDVTPGVVSGYDLVWNFYSASRGGGAVNVEPRKGSRVWGLLIEVEDPLLRAFDQREGHPTFYSRGEHRVAVKRTDGKTVFAWLYRARPNRGERRDVWPTPEYKQKILEAALFWKFPRDYVQQIKSWKTQ